MKKVNFTRKIIDENTIRQMKTNLTNQGVLAGSAVEILLDDLLKLRSLCKTLVESYNGDRAEEVEQALNILRQIV